MKGVIGSGGRRGKNMTDNNDSSINKNHCLERLRRIINRVTIKHYMIILFLFFSVSIIPLFVAAKYDVPMADDFWYSSMTSEVWEKTQTGYNIYSKSIDQKTGKEKKNYYQALQPGIFGESFYGLGAVFVILSLIVGVLSLSVFLFKVFFHSGIFESLFIGMTILFVILQTMPDITQGVYWFNGAVNYSFFWAVQCLFTVFVLAYHKTESVYGCLLCVLGAILTGILLEGANHITAFSGLLFMAVVVIYDIIKNRKKMAITGIVILVLLIIGFIFNIMSPGTRVRQDAFSAGKPVLFSIISSICHGIWMITEWTDLKLIYIFLAVFPVVLIIVERSDRYGFVFHNPLINILISVLFICALYCPGYYAMGYGGTTRIENVVYYTYIFLYILNSIFFTGWIYQRVKRNRSLDLLVENRYVLVITGLIALCLFVVGVRSNAYWALKALVQGRVRDFTVDYITFIQ